MDRSLAIALTLFLWSTPVVAAEIRWSNPESPVVLRTAPPAVDRPTEHLLPHASHLQRVTPLQSKPQAGPPGDGFVLPLRPGISNPTHRFFSISAFVDHDEARPDGLLDWSCGNRTYDTEDFDHNGTDYQDNQFPWLNMANDGLVVVAAADGIITDRHDGEPDMQCEFSDDARANLVVVQHDDGSRTIYAHMKTGTVTSRQVGDTVYQGDYLGVVGSSGFSSGPHVHFGVVDDQSNDIDPYAGECNNLNLDSWWQEQEAYINKGVINATTHGESPEYPPCPGIEKPNLKDVFDPLDEILAQAVVKDYEAGDVVSVQMLGPGGQVLVDTSWSSEDFEFAPWISVIWTVQFNQALPDGEYQWTVTHGGESLGHIFHVGSGPSGPAPAVDANNAWAGLWYDPSLDGEGFNFVPSSAGVVIYFYGSDQFGNRLWLASDLVPGAISNGKSFTVTMYESTGGTFDLPVPSRRGLSPWGTLEMTFSDCENGESILDGEDGTKVSDLVKLIGVSGADCAGGEVFDDGPWSGLWYDTGLDGEGYNLIVSPFGRMLYFYGFDEDGLRLWLVSDLITDELQPGVPLEVTMFRAIQGTFDEPSPSSEALEAWGTATITVIDCDHATIEIVGDDGSKTSDTIRLIGIVGQACTD